MNTKNSLIRNSKQVRQSIDFTGIQNANIHPSDIDAVLEFDNDVLILIEVKRRYNKIPIGQLLMLQRICDSWRNSKSVVLKVWHEFDDDDKDIPLSMCFVDSVYHCGIWFDKKNNIPLVSYLNKLGEKFNCKKCKF